MIDLLFTGPDGARHTVILAHGAGAPMDSPYMQHMAAALAERSIRVARFEFAYMAGRRRSGKRRPPPRAENLMGEYRAAVDAIAAAPERSGALLIGGKSMGGRVASMVADALFGDGRIAGLVCLGYPFHPPGIPEKTRTEHLLSMRCPALIVQGERDPFGSRAEVEAYPLAPAIKLTWIGDGDHDFGPRGASGFTRKGNLAAAADAVAAFADTTD